MLDISGKSENPSFFRVTQQAFNVSDSVVLKVYSNTNPQNMKIANLQKGLILLCDGIDVIWEGTGFGVSIASTLMKQSFQAHPLFMFVGWETL